MNRVMVFIICFNLFAYADESSLSKTITFKTKREALSNNLPSWSSNSIDIFFKNSNNISGGIQGEKLSRYDLDDKRIKGYLTTPITDDLFWDISYTKADKGNIVPNTILYNRLLYKINKSILTAISNKNSRYTSGAQSKTNGLELISYYKNFRYAYTHDIADVKDAGKSANDKVTIHYFYDNHYTALLLSLGEELEALPNNSILSSYVKSVALYGQYWFSKKWGCGYSASYTEQGDIYTKKGISLAAIYRF